MAARPEGVYAHGKGGWYFKATPPDRPVEGLDLGYVGGGHGAIVAVATAAWWCFDAERCRSFCLYG
jgi:hypothetical protein